MTEEKESVNQPITKMPPLKFGDFLFGNDFELTKRIIKTMYYLNQIVKPDSDNIPKIPDDVVVAIAIYMEYGWNDKSKQMVVDACGLKTKSAVNLVNKKARDFGFMKMSKMNARMTEFTPLMEQIVKYNNIRKANGIKEVALEFTFKSER